MDALRGVAIILVIYGHALQLAEAYTGHRFNLLSGVVGVMGPLRMPLLFFLSGMLVSRSLAKGRDAYFRGKIANILYPYVLWTFVLIGASALFSTVITWWAVPPIWSVVTAPIEHLWFLAYLLVFYPIAYVARKVNPLWVVLGATVLMSVPVPGVWGRLAELAVPFFLGIAIVRYKDAFERITQKTGLCAALLVTAVAVSLGDLYGWLDVPPLSWALPILLAFFFGTIGVIKPVAGHKAFAPLRYVGRRSLIIYILHWPTMLYLIPLLVTAGVANAWTLFLIALVVGTVIPVGVALLADRVPVVNRLFSWGALSPNPQLSASPPSGAYR